MWQDITRDEKTLRPCFYVKHAGYDVISSPGNRKKVRIMKNLKEQLMHMVFLLSACVSILCVAMICVFSQTVFRPSERLAYSSFWPVKSGSRATISSVFCL